MGDLTFYALVVGFCFGILISVFYVSSWLLVVWLVIVSLGVGLISWRRRQQSRSVYIIPIILFLLSVSLGLLRVELASWKSSEHSLIDEVGKEVTLEGYISREVDKRAKTQHLYIKTKDEVILAYVDPYTEYQYGDKLEITGELERPAPFATDLGRTFNYPGYLKAQGVNYVMTYPALSVIGKDEGSMVLSTLLSFKQLFMTRLESLIEEPAVGLGEGLLLGVKQALGDELETVFRRTGIIHIVVLSGYNVSLVVLFTMYILSYLFPYRARLIVGGVAIVGFALIVGLSATVVRASLMATFILLGKYLGRTYSVIRGLLVAGLIMLIINPFLLPYDVGFQLSFLATLGLILLSPYVEKLVQFMPKTIGLREFLAATIATQLFVMPILLYQIGEFSMVSIIVNVLVLPMVPLAMLLTFLAGLLGFVSHGLALPVAFIAQLSLNYILMVAKWFASLPFAAYNVPAFPFIVVPLVYGLMFYLWWRLLTHSYYSFHELSDWTIVEEKELVAELKKDSIRAKAEPPEPIFFR